MLTDGVTHRLASSILLNGLSGVIVLNILGVVKVKIQCTKFVKCTLMRTVCTITKLLQEEDKRKPVDKVYLKNSFLNIFYLFVYFIVVKLW